MSSREMQSKTTVRCHYISVRMAKTLNTDNTKLGPKCEATETFIIAGGNAKRCSHFGRQFLTKLNILSPHEPAIPLLGTYPEELKTYVHTKTCMHTDVYNSFTHSCWNLEATKVSFRR